MKLATSVGVAAALLFAPFGCKQEPKSSDGDEISALQMNLLLPDNSQIETVTYDISGPATRTGTVNVNNSSKVKFRVGNLPVSPDLYTIDVSAMTTEMVQCNGTQTFHIADNQVTLVMMALICGSDVDGNGDAVIVADIEGNCPTITGITALPAEVFVGSDMALHVDHTAGSTGNVMWTVDAGGSFSDGASADTNFTCLLPGIHVATVTLSEGECSSTFSAELECTDGGIDLDLCGDAESDPGEDCDDGNTVTEVCDYGVQSCDVCSATCQTVGGETSYCGDGVTDGAHGEGCDDGNMTTEACPPGQTSCTVCNATCQLVPGGTSFCGDGTIDMSIGETCEDGNTVTEDCTYGLTSCTVCTATCVDGPGNAHFCGDGNVDTANGEECDGGASCDSSCQTTGPTGPGTGLAHAQPGCADCRASNCTDVDFSGINALDRCFTSPDGSQSPADAQLCVDVLDCAFENSCAYGSTGLNGCWCTGTPAVCQSTAGLDANQGVCFDEILAATRVLSDLPSSTRDQQLDAAIIRLSQELYPAGAAFWMLQCDRSYCATECAP